MRARVKTNAPNRVCNAFGGIEYVTYEWREVPVGFEQVASTHSYLEVEIPEATDGEPVVDYASMTYKQLQSEAARRGLYQRGMKSTDLIAALQE